MIQLKVGADLKAHRRMLKAGFKPKAIRGRISLIARDQNWPQHDLSCALEAAGADLDRLLDIAMKHHVNLDWLFYGDIRGLQRRAYG